MSTHNIDFYEDLTKITFELSSNMHLIFSADRYSISFQPLAIVNSLISSCLCTSHTSHLQDGSYTEALLMSTNNLCLYVELTKNIIQ